VEALCPARSALEQIVAHPLAARDAARHDLQRLCEERFGFVEGVVGDDLVETSRRRKAGSSRILAPRPVVILPCFLQFLVRRIFLARGCERNYHGSSAARFGATLLCSVFERSNRIRILDIVVPPLRNMEPIFTALTVPTALMRRSLIAALAV